MFKGSDNEGQANIFSSLFTRYIEETASSALADSIDYEGNDLNSVSTISAPENHIKSSLGLNTVQENAILAYNSALETISGDFLDNENAVSTYTVQDGDTLSFIASDYGVTINTIIWANNLKSADAIKPGMDLKIPPVSGVIHKIAKGDTVASIAKKYGAEANKITSFNDINEGDLEVGEELVIPDGKKPSTSVQIASNTTKRFALLPNLGGYFGLPTLLGFNWGRIHGRNGVDVANSCGTAIFASADGVINTAKESGYNGGFGKYIKITHPNGTETLYGHLSKLLIGAGQPVSKGQQIALMGTTGRSTGCHVHFEVHGAKNPLAK